MEDFALFLKNKQITLSAYDFKKGSTIGVGGIGVAVFPRSFTEMIEVLDACKAFGRPFRVLGRLSNVLPPKEDTETVYVFTKNLVGLTMGEKPLVHAGVTAGALLNACRRHGKGGAEFLAGIPTSMGGAAFMNAGVAGHYFADIVRGVIAYSDGELRTYSKEECDYSYKHSRFMEDGGVIFAVILELKDEAPSVIDARIRAFLERRKHLPTGKSMGCVFKNPEGGSAGELIERAGLKGMRIGGAVVSEAHANFIINDRDADVEDVKGLVEYIKTAVREKCGVLLTEEIRYL